VLGKTPVIADYTFKMFLISYILHAGPPNVTGPELTYLPNPPLDRPGCINTLINVLKKINAVH